MFDNDLSINNVLISLEGVLQLEAVEEATISEVIESAVHRLENKFAVTFDRDVYALQSANQLTAESLSYFLKDMLQALSQLSMYNQLKIYHKNLTFTLSDINYLGYSREQLLTALRYLQDSTEYKKHHDDIVKPLYTALNNIPICSVKRLFIIMLMLDRLGVVEGVAIVAQLLYLGGLVT